MTPSCTSGTDSLLPGGSDHVHATRSFATLRGVISVSGLKPCASYVRRHESHSPGGGSPSLASSTGGFATYGEKAMKLNPPAGIIIPASRGGSAGSSVCAATMSFDWSMYATRSMYVAAPSDAGAPVGIVVLATV